LSGAEYQPGPPAGPCSTLLTAKQHLVGTRASARALVETFCERVDAAMVATGAREGQRPLRGPERQPVAGKVCIRHIHSDLAFAYTTLRIPTVAETIVDVLILRGDTVLA